MTVPTHWLLFFPPSWAWKITSMLITMLLTYMSNCIKPSRRCKCSPHLRLKGRGDSRIIKLMPFHWSQGTWSWPKLMPTKGGERWKTTGRRNCMKWNAELLRVSLPTSWKTSGTGCSGFLHQNWLFLITPIMGASLCSDVWAEQTRCATAVLEETSQKVSETEEVPQSVNCLQPVQHQTDETPLGWVNRKLCAFLRMSPGAPLLDQGWKVQHKGKGICRHQHQWSGCRGTDHTDEVWKIWPIKISSIPPLFVLEIASLKHGGYEMLSYALIFGMIILTWTQMPKKLLAFPMLGTSTIVALPQWDKGLCSTK